MLNFTPIQRGIPIRIRLLSLCDVLAWLAAPVVGSPASAQTSGFKLTVLPNNDMHGHSEPSLVSNGPQGVMNPISRQFNNLAKIAHLFSRQVQREPSQG